VWVPGRRSASPITCCSTIARARRFSRARCPRRSRGSVIAARCNTFTELEVCETCSSPRRDPSQLCVVETPADQLMVEQTIAYNGLYFVLMGRLSPIEGVGPRDIHFERLLARACDGIVTEVILATNFTQEGEATAHYLGELLRARGLRVTRLARGVPVGSELEYVDASTIAHALRDRRNVD